MTGSGEGFRGNLADNDIVYYGCKIGVSDRPEFEFLQLELEVKRRSFVRPTTDLMQ